LWQRTGSRDGLWQKSVKKDGLKAQLLKKRRKTETANTSEKDFETGNQHGEPTEKPTAQTKAAQLKKKTMGKANKEAEAKKRATDTGKQLSSAHRKVQAIIRYRKSQQVNHDTMQSLRAATQTSKVKKNRENVLPKQ